MAAQKKKKSGGKNRRDAHGVYERRAERGKAAFPERSDRNDRNQRGNSNRGYRGDSQRSGQQRSSRNDFRSDRPRYSDGYNNNNRNDRFNDHFDDRAKENILAGRNPVMEALNSGREIEKIYMAAGAEGSVVKIRAQAKDAGVVVDTVPRIVLDKMAPGIKHQGVIAEIPAYSYSTVEEILEAADKSEEAPFIVLLDEISDPHNLGAIIRTAECAGAHGVIIPKRNACGLTSTVAKTSAGALENMPVARVTNMARTIEELQEKGIWVAALDMDGCDYYKAEKSLAGPIAMVVGSEGKGIGRLVKEKCDFTVKMPMRGQINSLNASNAAAIIMYAIRRGRDTGAAE